MQANTQHENLKFANQRFAIYQAVENGPSRMMIRELIQNGIEASWPKSEKEREIMVTSKWVSGYSGLKLCIRNSGEGMSATELYKATDLACITNKQHGLDKNFGQGAKIASLKYNRLGIVYLSCKNNRVSKIIICRTGTSDDDYSYGRVVFNDPKAYLSTHNTVLDVTDQYSTVDIKVDWTEVILLGNSEDQDTATNPYGEGKENISWVAEELYHRFYHIDPRVKIRLLIGHKVSKQKMWKDFETIEYRRTKQYTQRGKGTVTGVFSRDETVTLPGNIKLHYIYDKPYGTSNRESSQHGGLQSDVTIAAYIYKGEMYSVVKGKEWTSKSPKLSLYPLASNLHLLIELPDNYPIHVDTGRKMLRVKNGENFDQELLIENDDFARLVRINRPDWVKKLIQERSKSEINRPNLEKEWQELVNNLSLKQKHIKPDNGIGIFDFSIDDTDNIIPLNPNKPNPGPDPKPNPEPNNPKISKSCLVIDGLKAGKEKLAPLSVPDFTIIYDEDQLDQLNIGNMAALYEKSTHKIFLNGNYSSLKNLYNEIYTQYINGYPDDEEWFTAELKRFCEEKCLRRVGYAVIYALMHEQNGDWTQNRVKEALSSTTLSITADLYALSDVQLAKSRFASLQRGGTSK